MAVMQWRCANKRKVPRPGAVDADLGPQIPPPLGLPAMTLYRPRERFDVVKKIKSGLFAVAGFILLGIALLALFFVAMAIGSKSSRAHDGTDWIRRNGFRNAVGELCCGERDCAAIPDSRVTVTPLGYRVTTSVQRSGGTITIHEIVPFGEATPTPPEIGGYWLCRWGDKRKCFFAPPGST